MDQACFASAHQGMHQDSIAGRPSDEPTHTPIAMQAAGSRPDTYPRTQRHLATGGARIRITDIVGDDLHASRFLRLVGLP